MAKVCRLCPGNPNFFSDRDFERHNETYHQSQRKLVSKKLKEFQDARNGLQEQLTTIKIELRNLYKQGFAKKSTADLVQKEINSLKTQITEKDLDINHFKTLLKKEEKSERELIRQFKNKMDKEYEALIRTPSQLSSSSIQRNDSALDASSACSYGGRVAALEEKVLKLSSLEVDVHEIKSKFEKLFHDKSNGFRDEINTNDMKMLREEIEEKSIKLNKSYNDISNLQAIIAEKEKELTLVTQLTQKYKESEEAQSKASSAVFQKLQQASEVAEDLNNKNKSLVDELQRSTVSLSTAKETISQLNMEKLHYESKIQEYELYK